MNIRQTIERREDEYLIPYATRSANSSGRYKEKREDEIRTAFMLDRDRIIHSEYFRRLKDKAQVIMSGKGGAYRTRLTHTLEVTQIARTIARALGLNEDLTEAIGLGHDLGHTPFGHAGERAIRKLTGRYFHHSSHSLRVVDELENEGEGLNLTNEVRNGIIKHTKGKGSIIDEEKRPDTPEGEIVRICDSIAYVNHDIDDALRYGLISADMLPKRSIEVLGNSHGKRIDTMVRSVITASVGKPHIYMDDEILKETEGLRSYMFENVYESKPLLNETEKVFEIIAGIYNHFKKNPDLFYSGNTQTADSIQLESDLIDFIAYLTDKETIELYKDIVE